MEADWTVLTVWHMLCSDFGVVIRWKYTGYDHQFFVCIFAFFCWYYYPTTTTSTSLTYLLLLVLSTDNLWLLPGGGEMDDRNNLYTLISLTHHFQYSIIQLTVVLLPPLLLLVVTTAYLLDGSLTGRKLGTATELSHSQLQSLVSGRVGEWIKCIWQIIDRCRS